MTVRTCMLRLAEYLEKQEISTITIGTSLILDIQVTVNRQLSKQGDHIAGLV